jgi:hypothetical protein
VVERRRRSRRRQRRRRRRGRGLRRRLQRLLPPPGTLLHRKRRESFVCPLFCLVSFLSICIMTTYSSYFSGKWLCSSLDAN